MLDEVTLSCAMLYGCDVQHDQPVSNVPCDCRHALALQGSPLTGSFSLAQAI